MNNFPQLVLMVNTLHPTPWLVVIQAKAWRWSLSNWLVLWITAWINKQQLHAVNPWRTRRRSELILFTFEFPRFVSENKLHFRVLFKLFPKDKKIFLNRVINSNNYREGYVFVLHKNKCVKCLNALYWSFTNPFQIVSIIFPHLLKTANHTSCRSTRCMYSELI